MGLYHEGYSDALRRVDDMTEAECLDVLDNLFGRDNLKYGDGIEELKAETRRQLEREFRNDADPNWGLVETMTKIHRAGGFKF